MLDITNPMEVGTLVTLCGIAIVFMVLIILIVAISIFGKIMVAGTKKEKLPKQEKIIDTPVKVVAAPKVAVASSNDNDELIAVIAAAVDAIYSGSGKKAVIRNIRPAVSGGRSAWATAGLMQNVKSF